MRSAAGLGRAGREAGLQSDPAIDRLVTEARARSVPSAGRHLGGAAASELAVAAGESTSCTRNKQFTDDAFDGAAVAATVVERDAGIGADIGEQAGATANDIDTGASVTISLPAGPA